jgi:hypothetical protein
MNDPGLDKHQIDVEYSKYLIKRKETCIALNIDSASSADSLVKLHWIQRNDGVGSFISVAHVLMRVFLYNNKLHISGLRTNASTPTDDVVKNLDRSFNSAAQNEWPVKGNTSLERMVQQTGTEETVGEWMTM